MAFGQGQRFTLPVQASGQACRVTVKHPDSDIPAGTLHNIEKQAGWK